VRRAARGLRGSRVSLAQLLVIGAASAIVSALIVVSALGDTAPQRAVIAALRTPQVIHAAAPPAPPRAPTAAPARTPSSAPATSGTGSRGGASSGGSGAGSGSGNASSAAPTANASDSSTTSATSTTSSTVSSAPVSKVKHLFVIALSTPSYAAAFGHGSLAAYLNAKLRPRGELLSEYRTLGAAPLPDLIAMVSGQTPNKDTTAGCATYSDFRTGVAPAADGLVPGPGCVYPNTVLTIGDQLDGAALPWRAYMEGMSAPCMHPNSGAPDDNLTGDYATARNPFVYFHSLLDLGDCQSDDLPYSRAAAALHAPSRTPSYAFISPSPCDSGAVTTCVAGRPTGAAAADAFLKRVVPTILHSAAYRASGALVIVFTATPSSSTTASSTTTPSATSAPAATATATASRPVRTGALVLSRFTKAGSTDARAYDPYSVLRTAEDVFSLSKLARAASAHGFDTTAFGRS
jgi:phosphatidylinositol-3-phosphatase